MLGRKELWDTINFYVDSPDLCLFDIDLPSGSKGTLRVFIARKGKHSSAVTIDECASVSKKISNAPEFDEMLHKFQLEVSSPGVNRRLRLPDHFSGAVGERVKLTGKTDEGKITTVVGVLESVSDDKLKVRAVESEEISNFSINSVSKAQIDFMFNING